MSVASELVLSEDEATLLAEIEGSGYFPGASLKDVSDAAARALVRGLRARGIMHGRLHPRLTDEARTLLRTILQADRSLSFKAVYREGEGESLAYVLFFKGDRIVRETLSGDDLIHVAPSERAAVDELLALALELPPGVVSTPSEPTTTNTIEIAEALKLGQSDGPEAVAHQFPNVAGFAAASADPRRALTVEVRTALDGGAEEDEMITLLDSTEHGFWIAHDRPSSNPIENVTIDLQRVTADEARAQLRRLITGRNDPGAELGR